MVDNVVALTLGLAELGVTNMLNATMGKLTVHLWLLDCTIESNTQGTMHYSLSFFLF